MEISGKKISLLKEALTLMFKRKKIQIISVVTSMFLDRSLETALKKKRPECGMVADEKHSGGCIYLY